MPVGPNGRRPLPLARRVKLAAIRIEDAHGGGVAASLIGHKLSRAVPESCRPPQRDARLGRDLQRRHLAADGRGWGPRSLIGRAALIIDLPKGSFSPNR